VKIRHRPQRFEQSAQPVEVQENDRHDQHDVGDTEPDAESRQPTARFERDRTGRRMLGRPDSTG
jgi:hypothetical protein